MPVIYTADMLTKKPQAINVARIDTAETRLAGASGRLVLKLQINERGVVSDAIVEQSDLPELYSETAIRAFRNTRFSPAEIHGRRVKCAFRIEVLYDYSRQPISIHRYEASSLGREN